MLSKYCGSMPIPLSSTENRRSSPWGPAETRITNLRSYLQFYFGGYCRGHYSGNRVFDELTFNPKKESRRYLVWVYDVSRLKNSYELHLRDKKSQCPVSRQTGNLGTGTNLSDHLTGEVGTSLHMSG
jgi:hypothetical protein